MKYQLLGKTGLKVSQLALGTGNFGTGWGYGSSSEESEAVLNAYLEAGGNFIDTADIYQFGQSEEFLGKLLAGKRDNVVLATKFSNSAASDANPLVKSNSRKAMVYSVEHIAQLDAVSKIPSRVERTPISPGEPIMPLTIAWIPPQDLINDPNINLQGF